MSSLNTFGAILSYAIEMEGQIAAYYQSAGETSRAADAQKRKTNLERVRRENVTEIKLEPIEGLHESDYAMNFADASAANQQAIETAAARFYTDTAPKLNVREAQRALERCAKQHRELAG